jgi:hypothetical protein
LTAPVAPITTSVGGEGLKQACRRAVGGKAAFAEKRHSMWASTQLMSSGANSGSTAAVIAKPNSENRHTTVSEVERICE